MPPPGPSRVLIVGCGGSLRRDDQAGLRIGEALARETLPSGVEVLLTEAPGADIPARLEGRNDLALLVVIDAALAGPHDPPGTWRRFDYHREPHRIEPTFRAAGFSPGGLANRSATPPDRQPCGRYDVHGTGVDAALMLAGRLGMLPAEVWVYALAVADVGYGEELTGPVAAAIGELTARVRADVAAWLAPREDGRA